MTFSNVDSPHGRIGLSKILQAHQCTFAFTICIFKRFGALGPRLQIMFFRMCFAYLIPIKIRTPLNFAPLILAPLIFAHTQISCLLNFCASLYIVNLLFFQSFVTFFPLPLIFAILHCANLLSLIMAQARCMKIKGTQILMGIRYLGVSIYTVFKNF